jgi:hypothetical protein
MNNEDIQGSPQGAPWNPRNDNYGGFKDKMEVFDV